MLDVYFKDGYGGREPCPGLRGKHNLCQLAKMSRSGLAYWPVMTRGGPPDRSRLAKDSLAYTLVLAVGYFFACSSNTMSQDTTGKAPRDDCRDALHHHWQGDRGLSR